MQSLCNAKQHALQVFSQVRVINFVNLCFLFTANSFPYWIRLSYDVRTILENEDIMMDVLASITASRWNDPFHQYDGNPFSYCFESCSYISIFFLSAFLPRDLLRIGVTLAGHQKKILSNIQSMRVQMSQSPTTIAWLQGALCHGMGSIRRINHNGSLRMTSNPSERARVETIVLI